MASITGSAISISAPARKPVQAINGITSLRSVSFSSQGKSFPSIRSAPSRFRIYCSAANQETVDKVCAIVKKQLALPEGTAVTGNSKFSELGADSLDTVEIVMGLEEAFEITVDEGSAQDIATVQDAADLIEKLVGDKSA
ncbi:acyl carrier protein 1, chloroplastic-like [Typha angustifolia]|uniref:acyl carrier protein 1, chloroplastic-like n=1 Tax=Typha angustifolia TaxID=59011 RepID=UPI003C2B67EB